MTAPPPRVPLPDATPWQREECQARIDDRRDAWAPFTWALIRNVGSYLKFPNGHDLNTAGALILLSPLALVVDALTLPLRLLGVIVYRSRK